MKRSHVNVTDVYKHRVFFFLSFFFFNLKVTAPHQERSTERRRPWQSRQLCIASVCPTVQAQESNFVLQPAVPHHPVSVSACQQTTHIWSAQPCWNRIEVNTCSLPWWCCYGDQSNVKWADGWLCIQTFFFSPQKCAVERELKMRQAVDYFPQDCAAC